MSGTPQKMLEHLLETRLGGQMGPNDPFLDDFLLTHIVFIPSSQLVDELCNHFYSSFRNRSNSHNDAGDNNDEANYNSPEDHDYSILCKKRVVQFIQKWVLVIRYAVFEDNTAVEFIENLAGEAEADPELQEEASIMHQVLTQLFRYQVIIT